MNEAYIKLFNDVKVGDVVRVTRLKGITYNGTYLAIFKGLTAKRVRVGVISKDYKDSFVNPENVEVNPYIPTRAARA